MSIPYAPDPFDTSHFLTLPALHDDTQTTWQGFRLDDKLDNETFYLPNVKEENLPRLEAGLLELKLDDVSFPSLDASSVSDYATADEDSREPESQHGVADFDDVEDVWTLPAVKDARKKTILTSWDHFLDENHVEPRSAYLSEAGVDVFDAIVQTVSQSPIKRLKPDRFLASLHELALGRSSIFFAWDAESSTFVRRVESFTITGFTPEVIAEVVETIASSGAIFNVLRRRQRVTSKSPSVIAFDASVRSCLAAVEAYMESRLPEIVSILSWQQIYEGPRLLLGALKILEDNLRNAPSDPEKHSSLLRQCLSWSLQHPKLIEVLNSILAAVFTPVLKHLAADLGLVSPVEGFHSSEAPPYHLLHSHDLLQVAKEAHESLVLLKTAALDRLKATRSSSNRDALRLAFSWNELHEVQETAAQYEAAARGEVLRLTADEHPPQIQADQHDLLHMQSVANQDSAGHHDAEASGLLHLTVSSPELLVPDEIQKVALTCLHTDTHQTSVLAVPLNEVLEFSLSPLIFAQHRLLSYSILDLLFSTYRLQSHLRLLHQIHLLGDGMFAARLNIALFDDGQATGEGQRRTGATTGLRLQARDSWPPASSELRLVLMGILSDSLKFVGMGNFEESISFAIRDLSDDELALCRDVDSIHALDFLKVHYKPPNPVLEAVFTSESLEKYDRIFRQLLRVLRMKSVAQSLLRSACPRGSLGLRMQDHRFRVEIQHFALVIANYTHNIAIAGPWARLQTTVEAIEGKVDAKNYDGTLQCGKSLERLRQLHSGAMDDILRALLLRQKEAKAMAALEEIMGTVLRYAAFLRRNVDDDTISTTRRLHDEFKEQVRRFVEQTKSASNRRPARIDSDRQESEPFELLLLMLDFNGYWTKV